MFPTFLKFKHRQRYGIPVSEDLPMNMDGRLDFIKVLSFSVCMLEISSVSHITIRKERCHKDLSWRGTNYVDHYDIR